MSDKSGSEKLLYCSFCGKSQHEVRKLIAGPSVFICDECIELCNDIIREESATDKGGRPRPLGPPDPEGDLPDPGRVRDRPGAGEEDPVGRGLQPLQAAQTPVEERRGRAREIEHPARRPDRIGEDAARADARAPPERPVRHRRRDHADRGRLRRRGRREHHPEAAAELRLRRRQGEARDRLHRRDRQDLAQERQPVDHARRVGRRRAAGAAQADRGHDRVGPAAGRPQASEPGLRPGRHDEHPVRLRRGVRRAGEDHPPALRAHRHRLRRRGTQPQERQGHQRHAQRRRARGPDQVRPDPGVRRPPAGGRHARGARRERAHPDPDRAEERADQAVPQAVRHGGRRPRGAAAAASRRSRTRRSRARPARAGLRSILEQVLLDIMFELPTLENVSKVVVDEPTILGDGKPLLIYSDQPKVAGSH